MSKRLLFSIIFAATVVVGWAQNDDGNKLSITTQMFLQELKGEISFERDIKSERRLGLNRADVGNRMAGNLGDRLIAKPDTIDGIVYISTFIRLKDNSDVKELEALGVQIQCKFDKGLITANIPVDKINEVAQLANVSRISVAKRMQKMTNKARETTNVDDILTLSTDAINAGLTKKYDGTGVLLGVIDTGIDFAHIAFKDKNGNSRIKRAYIYNGSSAQEYSSISSSTLTDDKTEDHGTHTSSTAGGSSVIVSGSTVTVTDNHTNATYGGMAPGADLYLAGINGLNDTYLANAFQKICNYADSQNQPVVVSNSWGGQFGAHDGTGDVADVVNQYFGNSHPNHICLFASSNDAGSADATEGGGYHVSGTSTSSNPLGSILRSHYYSDTDNGYYYDGPIVNAWARSSSVSSLTCKIYVLNANTGAIVTSTTVTPTTNGTSVSGLSSYFSGSLYAYKDYIDSDKTQVLLYTSGLTTRSSSNYVSNYTLAVEIYPSSGSAVIDMWGGNYCYFTNYLTTSGHTWKNGSDDMSVSDEATIANSISIGAYVSKNQHTDYSGTIRDHSDEYTVGDIAYFSSYATANESPTGLQYPWITAPGARLAAGVNHNHTTSVDATYSYYGSNFRNDLVVNSTTNPYAMMEGTSMATPVAAGIVALWLQASMETNAQHKNLTVNDVKTIMQQTAIKDSYTTTGANASHFGNGKIDALAGIQYILGASAEPTIQVNPTSLAFSGYATVPQTQSITVTGLNLEGNISIAKSGLNSNAFSIDKTSITAANAANGVTVNVTWNPTTAGNSVATLTLTSQNAETVTVSLSGTAQAATPTIIPDQTELAFSAGLEQSTSQTINVTGRFLTGNITATLNDPNGVFSVSPASLTSNVVNSENGGTLTVTFNSAEEGDFTGTLTLSGTGAQTVTISLAATASEGGTASDPYLNIAKYATIDEAGWRTALVNNLYKYTEDVDNEVAWLTLPIYGAFVGARYATNSSTIGSGHPQAWIESSLGNSNTYGGTTWNSSGVFQGSSTYFTSTTARAIGYNSRTNTEIRDVTFYVTNTNAIKLYGTGRGGASSSYPASLKVYECTVNGDGSLTASTAATKNLTNSSTTTFTLTADGLDVAKVYKVVSSIYRGYIYEIGFQTPIEVVRVPEISVSSTSVELSSPIGASQTSEITLTSSNLTGNVTATISGGNGAFTVNPTNIDKSATSTTLTVTFTPQAAQTYNATLTLASEGAESVTISLTGTGLQPEFIASPETLTFSEGTVGESSELSFSVLGENLAEGISLTLNDPDNVFALSQTTLTKNEALEGTDVTVTFTPTEAKAYSATITLTSLNAEPVTVNLSGSATPAAFDATITSVGLSTLYLDFPVIIPYDNDDLLGVYYVKGIANKAVQLARLTNIIPANTGVILHGNAGSYEFPKATSGTEVLKYDNLLKGTTTKIPVTDVLALYQSTGTVLTLGKGSTGFIGFYSYTGKTLPANKAFLIYEDDNNSKGLSLDLGFDGVATGIHSLNTEDEQVTWYTPQGIQLNTKPSKQGIYMSNGKKIVIK